MGCWLRKRDRKWELKIQKLKNFDCGIESNAEIEDEREILNELSERLTTCHSRVERDSYYSVEDFLQRTSCEQIACFTTQRSVYEMPNGVIIDLDEATFGYQVGELEIIVSSEKEVDSARRTIQKTAEILGVECDFAIRGKMEEYLSQNCRSHYEQLVKIGWFIGRAASGH